MIQLRMNISSSKYQTDLDILIAGVLAILLIVFVVWATNFLHKKREKLELKEMKARFGYLFVDLHLKRGFGTVFYTPIFFLRRLLFISIPTFFFPEKPWLQLQLLVFLSSLYLIWYYNVCPHAYSDRKIFETINEVMLLVCAYHLMLFSGYTHELFAQFLFGYSFILTMILIFMFNLTWIVISAIQ